MANDMIEVSGEISTDQNSTIQLDVQSMITSPIIVTDQSSLNNLKLEIEQIKQEAIDKINEVGNFQDLTTNNKTNLVLAINEVNSKFGDFITSSDLTLTLTTELSNYVLTSALVSDYSTTQQIEAKFASLDFVNTTLSQYAKSSVLSSLDARLTRLTSAATLKTPGVVIPAETHFVMNGSKLFLDVSDSSILSSTFAKKKDLLNLQSYVTGLKSEVFVGVCSFTADECVLDNTKLSDYVQSVYSREPKSGDVVKSSDGYIFKFSTTWEKQGQDASAVEVASTSKAGIVKLGTLDGELSVRDDAIAVVVGFDNLKNSIGSLDALKTTEKSSIVNAINEVRNIAIVSGGGGGSSGATIDPDVLTRLDKIEGHIGNLTALNTNDKTTLVNAINEIKASLSKYAESSALLNYVQTSTLNRTLANYLTQDEFDAEKANFVVPSQLSDYVTNSNLSGVLATYAKTSSVQQLTTKVNDNAALVGDLLGLTTSDKSSIVSSINEVLRTANEKTPITRTESIEGNVSRLTQSVGPVSTLETVNKSSVVGAINELKGSIDNIEANGGTFDPSVLNDYATKVEVDTKINNLKQLKATPTTLGLVMPKDEFKIGSRGELTLNFDQGSSLKTTLAFKEELQALEDKLVGGLTFRGIINQDSTAIDLDNELLNTFIQDSLSRAPQDGDFVEAQDGVVYVFSKSTWYKRNPALTYVPTATTISIGGVKLGSSEGQLKDTGDGVVSVVGFEELKNSVGTLASLSTSEQSNLVLAINEVNDKFSDYVLTTTLSQYTLKSETLALETKVDENKSLIGDLNDLTFGLKDSVVNSLNLLHGSLANYVESSTLSNYVTTSALASELSSYTQSTTTESLTTRIENVENEMGVVGSLATQEKSTLVGAINELKQESSDLSDQLALKADSSAIDSAKQELSRKIEDVSASIGDVSSGTTGLSGDTVSEHIIELKASVDQKANSSDVYSKGETYTKVEVEQKIDEKVAGTGQFDPSAYYTKLQVDGLVGDKLSIQTYNSDKASFATTSQLADKANASDVVGIQSDVQSLQTDKLDASTYNSEKINFATTSQLSSKAESSSVTTLSGRLDTVEGELATKVEQSDIDSSLEAKLGNLTVSGLAGTTVTDLLTDAKSKIDTKLEVLAANSTFATKTEVSQSVTQLEQKDTQLQQSIDLLIDKLAVATGAQITLGAVDEDHTQVDLDKTILTNKVRTLTSKAPVAGQKLYSSDHYEYVYVGPGDTDWTNLGLDKVAFASTSSAGIIKLGTLDGELEAQGIDGVVKVKGFDTLEGRVSSVESGKLDASVYASDKSTFATVDNLNGVQTQVSTAEKKITSLQSEKLDASTYNSEKTGFATSLSVTTLEGKVQTLESSSSTQSGKITDIENKIGDLSGTGLTGSTVTELLTDARTKMDSIQAGGIDLSNYYTKRDADGKFALITSLDDKLDASTYNSDKLSFATTANLSTLSQKVTTVEGTVSTQGSSISDLSSKLGNLQNTGLTGSTATELFTDVKTRLDGIDLTEYYTKLESDGKYALSTDLSGKLDASTYNSEKTEFAAASAVTTLEGKVRTLESTTSSQGTSITDLSGKLGDLSGTGLVGTTVTDLLTDAKTKIDAIPVFDDSEYYTKSDSDGKFALISSLSGKLDVSTYNSDKTGFATTLSVTTLEGRVDTLEGTSSTHGSSISSLETKMGSLSGTGLTGSTVTDLLTDAKSKIDAIPVVDTSNYYTKGDADSKFALTSDLASKLDASVYNSEKTGFASSSSVSTLEGKVTTLEGTSATHDSSISSLNTKVGNLQNTGLTGSTVTELLTDTKTRIDGINIGNYYPKNETYTKGEVDGLLSAKLNSSTASSTYATKVELADKANTSALDAKLDVSTYNSDKSTFATTRSVEQLNEKVEKFNNSIRPVLILSEDTSTVEGQSDTQAWLTQKLKTDKQLDPENGLVITTSDGDSYFYFDGQWVLRKTYKVGSVTNSTSGIVLGKDETGHGYIKASDALDGTMVLADYQDIVSSIGTKAESSAVSTLEGRVGTVESQLANKVESTTLDAYYPSSTVDSLLSAKLNSADAARDYATKGEVAVKANQSSIGDLSGTGLTGSTVTELLADAKTKIDGINISNYYPISETYNRTEINGFLTSKANDADVVKISTANELLNNTTWYLPNSINNYWLRFQCDQLTNNKNINMLMVHKAGPKAGYKLYLSGDAFDYMELWGPTLISDCKDPTADAHAANKRYVDNKVTTLTNNTVSLTGDQSIAGAKTFTSKIEINANNEVLKLKNTSGNSNYIAGYEDNTRIYYIGKDASSSVDLSIKNESSNGWITLKTKSKFDQTYTITDNEQIVHKKYVDDTVNGKVGTLSSLTTTNKNSVVDAINELQSTVSTLDPLVLPAGTQPTTANIGSMKVCFVLK